MIKIFTLKNKFQKESVNLKKLHLHQENQEAVKENRYYKADIDTFNFLIEDHNATLKKNYSNVLCKNSNTFFVQQPPWRSKHLY